MVAKTGALVALGRAQIRSSDCFQSPLVRAVIDALFLSGGRIGSASEVASRLGVDRFKLTRMLKRERLPSLRVLTNWVQVVSWVHGWELHAESLSAQARDAGADPAQFYRCVRRVTGMTWRQAKDLGVARLEERLVRSIARDKERRISSVYVLPITAKIVASNPRTGFQQAERAAVTGHSGPLLRDPSRTESPL